MNTMQQEVPYYEAAGNEIELFEQACHEFRCLCQNEGPERSSCGT